MPDFSTIDSRCFDSWYILISGQFKHGYPLNIPCSNYCDSCKIKRMVINLTQLGFVNNCDKNRYLDFFSKAAVHTIKMEVVKHHYLKQKIYKLYYIYIILTRLHSKNLDNP